MHASRDACNVGHGYEKSPCVGMIRIRFDGRSCTASSQPDSPDSRVHFESISPPRLTEWGLGHEHGCRARRGRAHARPDARCADAPSPNQPGPARARAVALAAPLASSSAALAARSRIAALYAKAGCAGAAGAKPNYFLSARMMWERA